MIMGHVGDTAFLQKKPISPGHVTAFLPARKKKKQNKTKKQHITTFGALGGLAHSENPAVYLEHSAL